MSTKLRELGILEELTKNIESSIEEIEYAIAKPQYLETYLNNAIRFLKENNSDKALSLIAEEHDELVNEIQKLRNELEKQEQNFKNEEFKYRTECQNILSIGRIEAYDMCDKLAELEKVILDYYLALGYQVGVGNWCFRVDIMSHYKNKWIYIYFYKNDEEEEVNKFIGKTTKDMFEKAIEYFSTLINCNEDDNK